MKKIILLCTLLLLLSGCNGKNIEDNSNYEDSNMPLTKTKNCTNEVKEYYTYQERTIYFVCIDEIYLQKDITLKYHLQNTYQTFDDSIKAIVSNISDVDYLKDGETKIYNHSKYTIIICNTLDGNKDIYFGDTNLEYQQEYCK